MYDFKGAKVSDAVVGVENRIKDYEGDIIRAKFSINKAKNQIEGLEKHILYLKGILQTLEE